MNDTSGLGIDAAIISNQERSLKALATIAPYVGYQHFWKPKLRSSAVYGFVQVTNTGYQPGSTFHKSDYIATNVIWNVFGSTKGVSTTCKSVTLRPSTLKKNEAFLLRGPPILALYCVE